MYLRKLRHRNILTLKRDGRPGAGTFERDEIEVASPPSAVPDLALLGAEVEAEIMRVTGGQPLLPVFATDIRRVVRPIIVGVSKIEAAFDSGFIVFGVQKTPVREIELELKAGDPTDLYQLGLSLVDDFPMRLGIITKAQRGTLLIQSTHATACTRRCPAIGGTHGRSGDRGGHQHVRGPVRRQLAGFRRT